MVSPEQWGVSVTDCSCKQDTPRNSNSRNMKGKIRVGAGRRKCPRWQQAWLREAGQSNIHDVRKNLGFMWPLLFWGSSNCHINHPGFPKAEITPSEGGYLLIMGCIFVCCKSVWLWKCQGSYADLNQLSSWPWTLFKHWPQRCPLLDGFTGILCC